MEITIINIEQLESELSARKFKHRTWYKEGRSTAYALKGLATSLSGSWIEEKEIKSKGETALFKKKVYEYIIKSSGTKSFYRPKDKKEIYFFAYYALKFETEQNKKDNEDADLMNIDDINIRFERVNKIYNNILKSTSESILQ